ncbi:MAG: hypothetical protein NUV57_03325, partial [archaeon]|nr:hypothetical protein [archaeon]
VKSVTGARKRNGNKKPVNTRVEAVEVRKIGRINPEMEPQFARIFTSTSIKIGETSFRLPGGYREFLLKLSSQFTADYLQLPVSAIESLREIVKDRHLTSKELVELRRIKAEFADEKSNKP